MGKIRASGRAGSGQTFCRQSRVGSGPRKVTRGQLCHEHVQETDDQCMYTTTFEKQQQQHYQSVNACIVTYMWLRETNRINFINKVRMTLNWANNNNITYMERLKYRNWGVTGNSLSISLSLTDYIGTVILGLDWTMVLINRDSHDRHAFHWRVLNTHAWIRHAWGWHACKPANLHACLHAW